jgi:hypothetical protein
MNNKGFGIAKVAFAFFAFFILTIVYTTFDPVIEDNLYGNMVERVDAGSEPEQLLGKYLKSWQSWVIPFIIAIFIYILTAGHEVGGRL